MDYTRERSVEGNIYVEGKGSKEGRKD